MADELGRILSDILVPGVPVLEKLIRSVAVYAFLVVLLRLAGRRTLGQMNAFDLVVLLTLSNTVQNAIIGEDNSLTGGMIGATTLVVLNVLVGRFLFRHPRIERRLEGEPVVLVEDGRVVQQNLERALISEDELLAAVRHQGFDTLSELHRVVLETSGAISVMARRPNPADETLPPLDERLERIERQLAAIGARVGADRI
ncbi:MAG TPA: YetF domain-containing protein [Chloroflexota bacterium]|jgi:uncharacterized membrane protein YcaP (DUF421 family)|nr:YetF domain-containing protein [Chloroflexota bacterium]